MSAAPSPGLDRAQVGSLLGRRTSSRQGWAGLPQGPSVARWARRWSRRAETSWIPTGIRPSPVPGSPRRGERLTTGGRGCPQPVALPPSPVVGLLPGPLRQPPPSWVGPRLDRPLVREALGAFGFGPGPALDRAPPEAPARSVVLFPVARRTRGPPRRPTSPLASPAEAPRREGPVEATALPGEALPRGQGALPLVQGPGDDRWRSPRPPPRVGRWAAGRTGIGPRAPGGLARRPVPARGGRSRGGSPAPGRWRGPRGLSRPTGRSGRERSGTGERLDGLVCLAVAQVLLGCHSERRWLRFAQHRLGHLFTLPAPATR